MKEYINLLVNIMVFGYGLWIALLVIERNVMTPFAVIMVIGLIVSNLFFNAER